MTMSLYVDIEKDFRSFHLSTRFEAGQGVMGILGASGCGKSMTLRCVAGVVKPDRGKIELDGVTWFDSERGIDLPPQKRRVGLLFQNYALFPNMTVEKNLMAGLRTVEKDKKKARAVVAEMMERFCLTGLERHRPSQLSGGQQQRAALARILLTKPGLLMLDEPFSALDGYLRWKLEMELMDILRGFSGPTLFVSHSRDEIYRICDRVCVMDNGKSTPVAPVKTMFEEPKTLAACMLSGCKNYSGAEADVKKNGEEQGDGWVWAKDWGVSLNCRRRVPENITHIGVRSHYIHLISGDLWKDTQNVMECRIRRIVEDVFNMVVMVSSVNAVSDSSNAWLRLEMPKEQWEAYKEIASGKVGDRIRVRIDPQDILLLTS